MFESPDQNINWEAPAGRLLQKFISGLPKDRAFVINVFGSSPLQLKFDPAFLSGDVDIFGAENLQEFVQAMQLGKGESDPYIEVVPANVFIATPVWRDRADRCVFGHVTIYLANPLDVLVGKIKRLESKDLEAFDLVKAKTGGPDEKTLKKALQDVVDMYRPSFDEENPGGDATANTRRLWLHLFNRDIDVRQEIIMPGLEARREAYGQAAPAFVQKLRDFYRASSPDI